MRRGAARRAAVWGMLSDRLGRVRVIRLTLLGAAVFVGGGFAFMHSTLQTWATEVVAEARATVTSLFAAAIPGIGSKPKVRPSRVAGDQQIERTRCP